MSKQVPLYLYGVSRPMMSAEEREQAHKDAEDAYDQDLADINAMVGKTVDRVVIKGDKEYRHIESVMVLFSNGTQIKFEGSDDGVIVNLEE